MRLRLSIHRYSLPETYFVWDLSPTEKKSTIAAWLESINKVIPLESEEGNWGLEDYAVEIPGFDGERGFECLHFGVVGRVFRDDEVVLIRPLMTQDARLRRESGRTQISTNGMKLIDGVPFGKSRPLQENRIRRPTVSIPPLKRRRITYDQEEEVPQAELENAEENTEENAEVGENGNRQLVLSTHFDEDDEEDDEDFVPGGEDDEDDTDGDDPMDDGHRSDDEASDTEEENPLVGYYDKHGLPKGLIESGKALEHMAKVIGESSKASSIYGKGKAGRSAKKVVFNVEDEIAVPEQNTIVPEINKPSEDEDEEEESGEETESSSESEDSSSDDSSDDSSDEDSDSDEDSAANPAAEPSRKDDESSDDSSSSDSSSDSDSDSSPEEVSSKTITLGNQASIKTNTAAPQVKQKPQAPPGKGQKGTKKRNERRRNTNALKRMQDRGFIFAGTTLKEFQEAKLRGVTTSDEAEKAVKAVKAETDSAPKVNPKSDANAEFEARRKQLLESLASGGIEVSPQTLRGGSPNAIKNTVQEYVNVHGTDAPTTAKNTTPVDKIQAAASARAASVQGEKSTAPPVKSLDSYKLPVGKENCLKDLTFVLTGNLESMTRRQARELIAKYGGEVITNPSSKTSYVVLGSDVGPSKLIKIQNLKLKTIGKEELFELITKSLGPSDELLPEAPAGEAANQSSSTANKASANTWSTTPDSAIEGRRAKVDVGAGRRLLFGALGLKNPKTKADEDKIRNDLMNLAKPLKVVEEPAVHKEPEVEEPLDSWRGKLNLRAVECCQESIELSEPPFPFVQRWDPQQQKSFISKRGGGNKRKRGNRDNSHYYDEEVPDKSNKGKRQKSLSYDEEEYDRSYYEEEPSYVDADVMELNYDDPVHNINDNATKTVTKTVDPMNVDSQGDMDDLPLLPDDLSALSKLNVGNAKAGTVIAFKHLIMGPNYQPQYSPYKTAVVLKVFDSGELELTLAKRDREQREYDETTGERIYGHFEMPMDDEVDEEDDGFLALTYSELIEPLVVQEAPEDVLVEVLEDSPIVDDFDFDGADQNALESVEDQPVGTSEGAGDASYSNDAPAEVLRDVPGEKQDSTDNSTTVEHERAEDSIHKSGRTSIDHDSPMKSVEEKVAKKSLDLPTEDLLQQSAEEYLADDDITLQQHDSILKASHAAINGDDMEIDETFLEHSSLGRHDQSTPRPILRQPNEVEHDVQVLGPGSGQVTPSQDKQLNSRPISRAGDGTTLVQIEDSFLEDSNAEDDENSTPRASVSAKAANVEKTPASISESARQEVSLMIREAGFRTDVPSSILRQHQLNVQNTPGDAEVFEKLMREMAPDTGRKLNHVSSPQSKGFTSPTRARSEAREDEMSPSPVTWEKPEPQSVKASSENPPETSNIQYPKLQVLSSFSSQIVSDHGRQSQPDLSEDDTVLRPLEELDSFVRCQDEESSMMRAMYEFPSAQPRDTYELQPHDFNTSGDSVNQLPDDEESIVNAPDISPAPGSLTPQSSSPPPAIRRLSSTKNGKAKLANEKSGSEYKFSDEDSGASDSSGLPMLSQIMSQEVRIKSEPRGSQSQLELPAFNPKLESMARNDLAVSDSDDFDFKAPPKPSQTLPKTRSRTASAIQMNASAIRPNLRSASASQAQRVTKPFQAPRQSLPPRIPNPPKSSLPPRASQAPSRSQMIDLTLSSIDIEPETQPFSTAPQVVTKHEDDEEEDEEEDYTGPLGSGWLEKRGARGKSVEVGSVKRRVTKGGRVSGTQGKGIPKTKWEEKKGNGKGRRQTMRE